jgi:hypothetical protein
LKLLAGDHPLCGVVEKPWTIGAENFPPMLMQMIFRDYINVYTHTFDIIKL